MHMRRGIMVVRGLLLKSVISDMTLAAQEIGQKSFIFPMELSSCGGIPDAKHHRQSETSMLLTTWWDGGEKCCVCKCCVVTDWRPLYCRISPTAVDSMICVKVNYILLVFRIKNNTKRDIGQGRKAIVKQHNMGYKHIIKESKQRIHNIIVKSIVIYSLEVLAIKEKAKKYWGNGSRLVE